MSSNNSLPNSPCDALLSSVAHFKLESAISFLSPSLRYVREKREDIDIPSFLGELRDFYEERLTKNSIKMTIVCVTSEHFAVHVNRGKLTQIIDNLVLNSEYWLKEDLAQKRISAGCVTFEVDRPFVRVWDNGRGIDPSVEHALFEPFISAKAHGQGRGLGLFIIKQLLDSEGCSVGVIPEKNRYHRFFKFQIDLRGAING